MIGEFRPIQCTTFQQELQHPGYIYREYAPGKRLAAHVSCYWTLDFDARNGDQPHRIIPDGCVDIIVDRLSPSCRRAAFVVGLMTTFEVMSLSSAQSMFGVRLFSESAHSILKYPVSAFIGEHVFLEDIWGTAGLCIVEDILSAAEVSQLIAMVEQKLSDILNVTEAPGNSLLYSSMKYIYSFKGSISTADLAEKLGYSERHLRRTFDRELGLSPKEMLGIVRFQSMLQELYSGACSSLTDIAMEAGYYDQSHFIKNFKRYYGILPKQVFKTGG